MLSLIQADGTLAIANQPQAPATGPWKAAYFESMRIHWKPVFEAGTDGKLHDHTPMPPFDLITSLQIGFIAKKPSKAPKRRPLTPPYSHKLCVEAWTVPVAEIVRHKKSTQWRKFAQLRTEAGFEKTIRDATVKGHIMAEFRDWALALAHERKPNTGMNDLWGLIHDNNNGWHYYDEHLIKVEMDKPDRPVVSIWRDRVCLGQVALGTDFAGHSFPDGATQTHTIRLDIEH
ncbi:hypothetical protein SAMN04487843_101345 [Methylobacterium sp. ap11]|uniref:hypothetical protein n=1 Tax=Methylobacterium sp. ap11 TaxID=1761799 RepID=UPI0008B06DD3|nr:hypothetical protein [Methylobacterium sp. ap11]SEO42504.1 hypothetical protein SAMN04487843_101345 [Methylobacterium sp. ap11]